VSRGICFACDLVDLNWFFVCPALYVLMMHMVKQRRKVLGIGSGQARWVRRRRIDY
jgi:hypothetical protein